MCQIDFLCRSAAVHETTLRISYLRSNRDSSYKSRMERIFKSDKVKLASHLLSGWVCHKLLTVGLSVHIKNYDRLWLQCKCRVLELDLLSQQLTLK